MRRSRKKKLEADGWNVGTAEDFLGLSPEEAVFVEIKARLSKALKTLRLERRLTQEQVAGLIQSSQSRVAKMEAGDPSVSFDLLVRSHFALGGTPDDLAQVIRP